MSTEEFKSNSSITKPKILKYKHGNNIDNDIDDSTDEILGTDYSYKHEVLWPNASFFVIMHALALWGLYLLLSGHTRFVTFVWAYFYGYFGGEGITIAAHRFYTHRTFKAKAGLRALFLLMQTTAGENSMYTWVRDHRSHHKYSDTDADPHNAQRGLFFSHLGWIVCKKHPFVKKYGKKVDMSDLDADWMVRFQKKYYLYIYVPFAMIIPVVVPVYVFKETWLTSILVAYFLRYVATLNLTWSVNSFAHVFGTRPYDRKLVGVESWFVSLVTWGEGFHNYHHAFPCDYKCAELSMYFNQSAKIIRFFERMGWAYDLKTVSPGLVEKRITRTGDGSHYELGTDEGRAAVTALGLVHPINPSYTSTLTPPKIALKSDGCPLYQKDDDPRTTYEYSDITNDGNDFFEKAPRRQVIENSALLQSTEANYMQQYVYCN